MKYQPEITSLWKDCADKSPLRGELNQIHSVLNRENLQWLICYDMIWLPSWRILFHPGCQHGKTSLTGGNSSPQPSHHFRQRRGSRDVHMCAMVILSCLGILQSMGNVCINYVRVGWKWSVRLTCSTSRNKNWFKRDSRYLKPTVFPVVNN